jgi:drug/metabolite transporter (DMT)-like permease
LTIADNGAPTHRSDPAVRRALLLMTAAASMFGAMAFTAKLASARLAGPQVAMIRFAIGLVPCLLVPRYRRAALHFQRLDLLFLRGFFGGLAVLLYFIAIEHTTVGVATLLNYTAPLYSGFLSMLFLGEEISAGVLIPMPVALLGVFLVVHAHAAPGELLGFGKWELIGACSAVASGAAVTAMRAARRGENSWSVYGSFCLLGLFVTMPQGLWSWKTPTASEWVALLATSLFAIGAQLTMTFTLRWVDAMTVGVISQLAVIISMALGATLLNDRITPLAALGSALTISGVIGVVYVTSLTKRRAAADEVAPES